MKTFVLFPTLCVFLLTLTLLKVAGQVRPKTILIWSVFTTAIFGGLMTWFSANLFTFLYYSNFSAILIIIPCLTYLINKMLPDILIEKRLWLRIFGFGLASTILTLMLFGTAMFFSLIFNPTDPAPRQGQSEIKVGG